MKNFLKLIGIIATAMIIGFSMIACGDDSGGGGEADPLLNGTWSNADEMEITFNDGNFEIFKEGTKSRKGTYTTSDNNITVTITQIWGGAPGFAGQLEQKWYTKAEVITWANNHSKNITEETLNHTMFPSFTGTYSINGNTLTMTNEGESPTTYTKIS